MACCDNPLKTEQDYVNFVFKLPTFLSSEISVMDPARPVIWRDLVEKASIPYNMSSNYQKLGVHTARYQPFSGLSIYSKGSDVARAKTAAGAGNANCGYGPFHKLKGLGFERKTIESYSAEFISPKFCIEDLWKENVAPEEMTKLFVDSLKNQLGDIIERTHRNVFESFAKKVVAIYTPAGDLLTNSANGWAWPTVPAANVVSLASWRMLEDLADTYLTRFKDSYAIGYANGEPVFPLVMNSRTKAAIIRNDPTVVRHLEFSSMADDLLKKYAPLDKIGRFVIMVDDEATRLRRLVGGTLEEIPAYISIPAPDGGEMTVPHPDWYRKGAEFLDTIMIPAKNVWKKLIRDVPSSVGGLDFGTQLQPELQMQYINFATDCDPLAKNSYFMAKHEFFIEPGMHTDIIQLAVSSGFGGDHALYPEQPVCPTPIVLCNTAVSTGCPCATISCLVVNPTNPTQSYISFSLPFTPAKVAGGTITLETATGGTEVVTVATPLNVSADGKTYLVQHSALALANGPVSAEDYLGVACEIITYCDAEVLGLIDCRSEVTNSAKIRLDRNLICSAVNDVIRLEWKGGFTANFSIVAFNATTHEATVRYAAGFGPTDDPTGLTPATDTWDLCCDRGMPRRACCVPTVANGCPACDAVFKDCAGNNVTNP